MTVSLGTVPPSVEVNVTIAPQSVEWTPRMGEMVRSAKELASSLLLYPADRPYHLDRDDVPLPLYYSYRALPCQEVQRCYTGLQGISRMVSAAAVAFRNFLDTLDPITRLEIHMEASEQWARVNAEAQEAADSNFPEEIRSLLRQERRLLRTICTQEDDDAHIPLSAVAAALAVTSVPMVGIAAKIGMKTVIGTVTVLVMAGVGALVWKSWDLFNTSFKVQREAQQLFHSATGNSSHTPNAGGGM